VFLQCSTNDGQTEFYHVVNFEILSYERNSQRFDACF